MPTLPLHKTAYGRSSPKLGEVAEAEITAHFNKAMEALDALDAEPERITPLRELALGLLGRNK